MFVLHVDLKVKQGLEPVIERIYIENFRPAISRQDRFGAVELLRPTEDRGDYRLTIAFEDCTSQQKWVSTEIHQIVWPQMEAQCLSYSVEYYNLV